MDADAANMFQMGPLLLAIADACLSAGATPVIVHHANKQIKSGVPMELEDLASQRHRRGSSARGNGCCSTGVSRFDPETRDEQAVSFRGRVGWPGRLEVVRRYVNEGVLAADMGGRKLGGDDRGRCRGSARPTEDQATEERERTRPLRSIKDQDAKALAAIDRLMERRSSHARLRQSGAKRKGRKKTEAAQPTPPTKNKIRAVASMSGDATGHLWTIG